MTGGEPGAPQPGEAPRGRGLARLSLRYRILVAIVLVNVLIGSTLAVFISLDARMRENAAVEAREEWLQLDRARISRLLSSVVVSRVQEKLLVPTLLSWPVWQEMEDAVLLNTEVDEEFFINPRGAEHRTIEINKPHVRSKIEEAMRRGELVVDGDWVAAPVTYYSPDDLVPERVGWGGIYFKPRAPRIEVSLPLASIPHVFLITFIGTVVLIVVTYVLLSRLLLRPVDLLQAASARIAHGDLDVRIPVQGMGAEMERLVTAFNTMARDVRDYHHHLEERIQEATEKVQRTQKGLVTAQRLAATGKLASGIAHEINNPLGGMINMARTLATRESTPAKRKEYLELILAGLRRIQDTVRRVLTFSPRELSPRRVELVPVLEQAAALVRHRLDKQGTRLVLEPPGPGLPAVFGDPGELQQAFLNLLMNSLDAVRDREDGGTISVRVEVAEGLVRAHVEDDGCGMEPGQVERAFDLFYTTKEVGEGTGLGLSIVHHIIVENHGGQLDLVSRPGKGTEITVSLPIRAAGGPPGGPQAV